MKGKYVLEKNGTFITLSDTNRVGTTADLSQASRFTRQEADALMARATKKTKGFIIRKVISGTDGAAETSPAMQEKTKRRVIPNAVKIKVYNQSRGRCGICGRFVPCDDFTVDHMPDEVGLQIDHIIPVSKGGKTVESNLQVLCSKCNGHKSDN